MLPSSISVAPASIFSVPVPPSVPVLVMGPGFASSTVSIRVTAPVTAMEPSLAADSVSALQRRVSEHQLAAVADEPRPPLLGDQAAQCQHFAGASPRWCPPSSALCAMLSTRPTDVEFGYQPLQRRQGGEERVCWPIPDRVPSPSSTTLAPPGEAS